MKKIFLNISIVSLLFSGLLSCVRFTETKFDEENLFHAVADNAVTKDLSKSVSSVSYNNGMIDDFNNGLKRNWWGSDKMRLSSKNDALIIDATSVGASYDRFGHRFSTFCDFSENNVLRIRARAEGNSMPVLRVDLKDAYGFGTNHVDTKTHILICDDYVDYYFRYEGKFEQGWPTRNVVNKKMISELELYINPGSTAYTGRIYIDEIAIINTKDIPSTSNSSCKINLNDNSKKEMKYWWVNNDKYSLKYQEKSSEIEITSRGTGAHYESFGRGFSSTNLSENSVIRLKIKAIGKVAPDFRMDLVDAEGNSTNGVSIIKSIPNDNQYRDYYFDFKDKFYQGWPQTKKVDAKNITELMFFLNPGVSDYYGKVYISEIEVVNNYIPNAEVKSLVTNNTRTIEFLNSKTIDEWWAAEGSTMKIFNENIEVQVNNNSVKEITIGVGFDTKDLSSPGLLKLVAKSSKQNYEIKFFDEKGNSTGAIPILRVNSIADGFLEYEFEISDALEKIDKQKIGGISIFYTNENNISEDKVVLKGCFLLGK